MRMSLHFSFANVSKLSFCYKSQMNNTKFHIMTGLIKLLFPLRSRCILILRFIELVPYSVLLPHFSSIMSLG